MGVIHGFRFHSAVIAGGGKGKRRWGLWELCEDKEQRGSPVVSSDRSQMHLSLSCYPHLSLPC